MNERHCGAWTGVWLVAAFYSVCAAAGVAVAHHLFQRTQERRP